MGRRSGRAWVWAVTFLPALAGAQDVLTVGSAAARRGDAATGWIDVPAGPIGRGAVEDDGGVERGLRGRVAEAARASPAEPRFRAPS